MDGKALVTSGYDRTALAYDAVAGHHYVRGLWRLLPHVRHLNWPAILDVGCGTGINLFELARLYGPARQLSGIDLSPSMIAVARAKAARLGIPADFRVADAEALPYTADTFDLLVSNGMYHWLTDRPRAIREMARVLRPGGQLLLTCVASPGYREWNGLVAEAWGRLFGTTAGPWQPTLPEPAELSGQLWAAGLRVEHWLHTIQPVLIKDVKAFIHLMATAAPHWLSGLPELWQQNLIREILNIAERRYPEGFTCTFAALETVAVKV